MTYQAYYKLNGNSTDFSGNSNNGTDTAVSYVPGKNGQCASFNGTSSKITLPNTLPNSRGVTTINIWYQKPVATTDYTIIGMWGPSTNEFFLLLTQGIEVTTTALHQNYFIGTSPQDTNWHMYTLVSDGTTNNTNGTFYIDGVLKGTSAYTALGLSSTLETYAIGYCNGSYSAGNRDECIIDNTNWNAQKIKTQYCFYNGIF